MKTNRSVIARSAGVFYLSWVFSLAVAVGMTGCVPIPVPPMQTGATRTNLTRQTTQQFKTGQSTVEDVVLALGEPDAVSADEYKLGYHSERALPVAVLILPVWGGTGINEHRICLFEFDARGCLLQATQKTSLTGDGADMSDELPLPRWPDGETNPVPAWMAGERVWQNFTNSTWYAGMDGIKDYKNPDRTPLCQSGHLILTESNLYFFSEGQFANAEPVLQLPLATVTDTRVDRSFYYCMLVVRAKPDQVHSFVICKPVSGFFSWGGADRPATQLACDFIQSKIKPARIDP